MLINEGVGKKGREGEKVRDDVRLGHASRAGDRVRAGRAHEVPDVRIVRLCDGRDAVSVGRVWRQGFRPAAFGRRGAHVRDLDMFEMRRRGMTQWASEEIVE